MTPTPTPTPQSTLKFAFRLSGKWGYKDEQGAVKIEAQFSDALPFVEGLAFAAMTNDGKTQYGVIDDKGAWVVSPSYDEVRSYCEDLAAVKIAEKWGYIDTAGTMAITPAYSNAYDFSGGLARVTRNGKYGFIDTTGAMVIANEYDDASDFSEGLAFVGQKDDTGSLKYYIIDTSGDVIAPIGTVTGTHYSQSLAPVRIGEGKYTYYNRRGKQAFDAVFGAAGDFAENLAPVKSEGKWGFINASGEFVIQPAYQQARSFSGGYAAVMDDTGKWGFIDAIGTAVIECKYEEVGDFSEGYALARKPAEQGMTDAYNNYKQLYVLSSTEQNTGENTEGTPGTVKVDGALNIRESASASSNRLGKLANGDSVTILGEEGDWYKIQAGDIVGYVKQQYVVK